MLCWLETFFADFIQPTVGRKPKRRVRYSLLGVEAMLIIACFWAGN